MCKLGIREKPVNECGSKVSAIVLNDIYSDLHNFVRDIIAYIVQSQHIL